MQKIVLTVAAGAMGIMLMAPLTAGAAGPQPVGPVGNPVHDCRYPRREDPCRTGARTTVS